MSDSFGNKCGGYGKCEYCHNYHGNVSYHRANECLKNPYSWASKELREKMERTCLETLDQTKDTPKPITSKNFEQLVKPTLTDAQQSLNDAFEEFFNPKAEYNGGNLKPTTNPPGLHFKCNSCQHPLTQPGAILFSPPRETTEGATIMCSKYHFCQECYELICDAIGISYNG